ncbi:MAG: HAD family hydrolase [Candidatus Marsarchaeota archaeon]|jgi:HAD superfamily hydrolase (TIGR01549 family)|nr:HAD family hydrolase [Candidatus Marsarchaeota archaeon]
MIKAIILDLNDTLDENFGMKLNAMEEALAAHGVRDAKRLAKRLAVKVQHLDMRDPETANKLCERVFKLRWNDGHAPRGMFRLNGSRDRVMRRMLNLPHAERSELYAEYLRNRFDAQDINKEFYAILPSLAKQYKLMLYTNAPPWMLSRWFKKHGTRRFFKKVYTAKTLQSYKPDIEAFEKILKENRLKPEECVMVGDDVTNDMLPANLAGIRTILFSRCIDIHIRDFSELRRMISG